MGGIQFSRLGVAGYGVVDLVGLGIDLGQVVVVGSRLGIVVGFFLGRLRTGAQIKRSRAFW